MRKLNLKRMVAKAAVLALTLAGAVLVAWVLL